MRKPEVVRTLEFADLPKGSVTPLLLDLVEDAAGLPVYVPVLVARGRGDGPVFGLTAAVHGNELNGIPVLHRLFEWVTKNPLRGTVVAILIANVPGFRLHRREFQDGTDLNDIMPGRPNGSESEVYAHRLIERAISRFDMLIDLHTASFGRINSLYVRVDTGDPTAARMARLLQPQIMLHNAASDGTLRAAASELGIPAVTFEIGNPQSFQSDYIRSSLLGIRRVMGDFDMTSAPRPARGRDPVLCQRSFWLYTDLGGLLDVHPTLTAQVREGEVVARLRNVFGDVVREYEAPESGVVIGKSVNPVGGTGARILHLGIPADAHHYYSPGRLLT
ncbi:MAG: succinylglutamate desuccinylase/aspartoacylase family protein [Planctomycetota bacterium]